MIQPTYAHKLVAHIAEEMAQAMYEEAAKNNDWYATHRDRNGWVKQVAPHLVHEARANLAEMLNRKDVPEDQKELIFDALKADREIPRGGVAVEH